MLENDKEKKKQEELGTVSAEVRDKLRARGHTANAAIEIELKKNKQRKLLDIARCDL